MLIPRPDVGAFSRPRMEQYSLDDQPERIKLEQAWTQVFRCLAADLPAAWVERFFRPLAPVDLNQGKATFAAPGKFVQEWVRERYQGTLERMLSDELGEPIQIDLVSAPRSKPKGGDVMPAGAQASVVGPSLPIFKPYAKFGFETFVVGQSNRLAFAGSKAVAAEPGTKYNPLFIYGHSGLGKTHLLHSIAREILARAPQFPLVYISAQQFAEEFVSALQNNRIEQFRRAQRNVGVWLVDDIQFIAGKDKTQEEVFHTFNHLQSLGKQIVLTSDRPPREIYSMDERLRSRFEAGLVADIQPPDTETRCAILQSKAEQENVVLEHDVAMYLAENVPGNIRVLEGALTRLVAQGSVVGEPVSLCLAARMIEDHYRSTTAVKPAFSQIVNAVSRHFKIPVEEIRGVRRQAPIVHARHIAVFLTRELTGDSWKHIGSLFGDRDHTSMMHGYQKINEMIQTDRELKSTVKLLMRNLQPE